MNEPQRLLKNKGPGAALLGAARAYRPPAGSRRQVRRMLGLPMVLSLGTLSAALASASASAKVLLVATAVTAVTGGGVVAYRTVHPTRVKPTRAAVVTKMPPEILRTPPAAAPSPVVQPPPPAVVAARPVLVRPRPRVAAPAIAVAPTAPLPAPPVPAEFAPVPSVRSALVPPPVVVRPPEPPPLWAEIALLDAAADAIRRNRFNEALARLHDHERTFPAGVLREEAAVLHITALFGAHQRDQARAQAQRFLLQSGSSLLAERVRSMLTADSTGAPPPPKGARP